MSVLFLIKRSLGYNGAPIPSKGLFNSASFVVRALRDAGVSANLVEVTDGNDIDREVTRYKPDICILEALWAAPEKVQEVQRLHPRTTFVVRLHSKTPFLATEGVAIDYLRRYSCQVAVNSVEADIELDPFTKKPLVVLPNIYDPGVKPSQKILSKPYQNVWIGCLGATRPLKNQLQQAIAAIDYAEATKRRLYFHINSGRVEQGGEQPLKNVRALFQGTRHLLIEHPWEGNHMDFMSIVKGLDISMQVSFTESFNIVTADAVWQGVPVIVSPEVDWVPRKFQADPTSIGSIVNGLYKAERAGLRGTRKNLKSLLAWNNYALKAWKGFLNEQEVR